MRFLKWLFQPIYLLLFIVLVALYVNREAIFSEKVTTSPQAEELISKVDNLVARLRPEQEPPLSATTPQVVEDEPLSPPVAETQSSLASAAGSEKQEPSPDEPRFAQEEAEETKSAEAVVDTEVAEVPTSESVVADGLVERNAVDEGSDSNQGALFAQSEEGQGALFAQSEEGALPVTQPESDAPVAPSPVVTADEPETSPDLSRETTPEPIPAPIQEPDSEPLTASSVPVSPLEIWRAARAAVWQGDLEGAVAHYRQLIAAQPDNFDAHGELGNVLLAQADVAAAIEAYSTAARLIYRAGHHQMAYRLAAVVARMDEEQGRALLGEFSAE